MSSSFNFNRDYQWEDPSNNTLEINTNPDFSALKDVHEGVWKLHVLADDCITQEQVFEISITINSLITGMEDYKSSEFNLYPNPANDQIKIVGTGINESFEAILLNIYGEVVLKQNLSPKEDIIDISTLSSGAYILQLNCNSKNQTIKFTKF